MNKLSKNEILLDIVIPVILIILTILSIVIPVYLSDSNNIVPNSTKVTNVTTEKVFNEQTGDYSNVEHKTTFVGYELNNLEILNAFKQVNHYPTRYVNPAENPNKKQFYSQGSVEEIDDLTLASEGTLQFVIYNYKKSDFDSKIDNSKFEDIASKTSTLLFYLPFAFDSATVWIDDNYYGTYGSMKNYDPNKYNALDEEIKIVQNKPEPINIKVVMPYEKEKIGEDRMDSAKVITIHYQAVRGANFKNNMPLVGSMSEVAKTINDKEIITISFISIMVALIIGFLLLIYIKFSKEHLPFLGIVLSALLLLISQLIALYSTVEIAKILSLLSVTILIFFAILSCKPKEKRLVKMWKQLSVITFVNIIVTAIICLATNYEFVLFYSKISLTSLCVIGCLAVVLVISSMSSVQCIGILIALIVPLILMFADYSLVSFMHPACLTLSISAIIILWHIFNDMFELEQRNQLLTKNLKAEVDIQTQNLSSALKDRETLISFISHDLRKASVSIDVLTNDMKMLDIGPRERQLTDQIKTKNSVVLTSLSEISTFMKRNFSDEEFTTCKVKDLFDILQKTLAPDCEANGINFIIQSNKYSVRCKKRALLSVISNLIFNAIEHAECQNITLSSKKNGDHIDIIVHDDGKGIENENVFSPYVTSQDKESNMGLGLFIVKTETEAQGGTISYKKEEGSTFIISLNRDYDDSYIKPVSRVKKAKKQDK